MKSAPDSSLLSALDALPPLRQVVETHGLWAKKSLGQNFLFDAAITDRIAAAAGDLSGRTVFEIGPGPGGLTRSLLKTNAARIIAIEYDARACAALSDLRALAGDRLTLMSADALKLDWDALLQSVGPGAVIVANLPYNIATPLLMGWLSVLAHRPDAISRMVLMFQKEVADRLRAAPGTKDYGRVSVLTQFLCGVEGVMTLPPGAFVPAPKVFSSVVRLIPLPRAADSPAWDTLSPLLQAAFSQRRKMLRTTLKEYIPLLEQLGIDPTRRAETLSLSEYINLARMVETPS